MEYDLAYAGCIGYLFKKYDNHYSDLLSFPNKIVYSKKEWG